MEMKKMREKIYTKKMKNKICIVKYINMETCIQKYIYKTKMEFLKVMYMMKYIYEKIYILNIYNKIKIKRGEKI